MLPVPGRYLSEITRALSTLKGLEARLKETRTLLAERKSDRYSMDSQRHVLERTRDINNLMEIKSRTVTLDKAIAGLLASETECLARIASPY